jgi:pimeloyl-ACP methyl ester carboxylesterase
MKHRKLADLEQEFDAKKDGDHGWLESKNSSDKTLVLVHGVTGGKEDMLPLAVEYEKLGYHVYCLDLPGHGDSPWHGEMTFSELAEWLRRFIERIGEPDVLISNSFSSAVVYAYIQLGFLPRKTHVILGCPTPDTSRLAYSLHRASNIIPTETSWYLYTTWLANAIRTSMAAKKLKKESIRWLIESEKRKRPTIHPRAGILLSNLLFTDNPYKGERIPDEIQQRMTVILGTKDNVVTRKTAHILRELLPRARHVLAHGSGHILHFEAVEDIKAHPEA